MRFVPAAVKYPACEALVGRGREEGERERGIGKREGPLPIPFAFFPDPSLLLCALHQYYTKVVVVSSGGRAPALLSGRSRVQTPAGPTLRVFKYLRRKCCLCNDIYKRLYFLDFSDKDENRRSRLTVLMYLVLVGRKGTHNTIRKE